ncbi:MAG TPA: hypothetical protein VNV41_09205 [Candidatus Acidoferrales bacterium]|jgi:hypothetical protein|nr:hypothetical protein [Candidatus Acidoferrales bacterium]
MTDIRSNARRLARNVPWSVLLFISASACAGKPASAKSSQPDLASASRSQTAAARAAERKKRFEEHEKRLENGDGSGHDFSSTGASDQRAARFVSPAIVGMLVNERQQSTMFGVAEHNLTAKAHWSLGDSSVAELVEGGGPAIVAKQDGTGTWWASIGRESSEAQTKVCPGDQ